MAEFDITKETALLKATLPSLPKRPRKNLFDILKIQHREIRNSNILAYFFNPNEEHGFGSLFYEALKAISMEKIRLLIKMHPDIKFNDVSAFDEVKSVTTEEQTKGADTTTKSIDIVLEGNDWVIGIENKINHHLANPLNTYWAHLKSKKKTPIGILLTLNPYTLAQGKLKNGNYFLNITHRELIECVQQNLQLTGDVGNTDLFYLREYFKNIESHYYHLKEKPEMEKLVQEVTKNHATIRKILEKKTAAESHIEEQITSVFFDFGYVKESKWFRRSDNKFDLFFYIPPAGKLMSDNKLWLCFEVRNKTNDKIQNSEFLAHFKSTFKELQSFDTDYMGSFKDRTHAFIYIEEDIFTKEGSFRSKFNKVITDLIKNPNAPVILVENYLLELGLTLIK